MQIERMRQEFRLAAGFFSYMKEPLTLNAATLQIKERVEKREQRFLELCRNLIYGNDRSPYRKLLLWAKCDYADLERSVQTSGLERTLEKLCGEGVYLTLEEFKSQLPICRNGLTIEACESDFDNPHIFGKSIPATTSGSRSKSVRVLYDWDFLAEEAANEMLLHEVHGLSRTPSAFWLPSLPSISGLHNLLMHLRFRQIPARWFSHLKGDLLGRTRMEYIIGCSRIFGVKMPRPEFTAVDHADRVAKWIESVKKERGSCMVKTFASSAIRIAQAAIQKGIDISGGVVFTGGEPLTERRNRYLASAGLHAYARYVATETGLIAAGCPVTDSPDSMHVYSDRIALIQRDRTTKIGGQKVKSLLFSTLSSSTGKILFNAELGDIGNLLQKPCDCLFGRAGMNLHISEVRSFDKLTGEGMTLLGSVLDEVVGALVEKAGGTPDDYQFWESESEEGLLELIIAVSPNVKIPDQNQFVDQILEFLNRRDTAANIASHFWKQANTLRVIRESPKISRGFKMLPIIKHPGV